MVSMMPASNIGAGAIATALTVYVLHICGANGIVIPQDVADGLPGLIGMVTAHIWDMATGGNRPEAAQPVDPSAKP